jgi:hypothetical protein
MASRSDTESRVRLWLLVGIVHSRPTSAEPEVPNRTSADPPEVPNRSEVLVTPGDR